MRAHFWCINPFFFLHQQYHLHLILLVAFLVPSVRFLIGSEILYIKTLRNNNAGHYNDKEPEIKISYASISILIGIFQIGVITRAKIARLSNVELSEYLSMSVIKGGLVVGLGQILFVTFSTLQCYSEASIEVERNWNACRRSFLSQTGIEGLIATFTVLKLVSGVFQKKTLIGTPSRSRKL